MLGELSARDSLFHEDWKYIRPPSVQAAEIILQSATRHQAQGSLFRKNRTGLFLEEALGAREHDKAAPDGKDEDDDDDQDDRDEGGAPAPEDGEDEADATESAEEAPVPAPPAAPARRPPMTVHQRVLTLRLVYGRGPS